MSGKTLIPAVLESKVTDDSQPLVYVTATAFTDAVVERTKL